jgi:predicted RNA methylase
VAIDSSVLIENLRSFYDFAGKIVVFAGAGRRQLLDSSFKAKKVIAVDKDAETLRELKTIVATQGVQNSIQVVASRFEDVSAHGDVVYFEFCLHEMADPHGALLHARALAPDIVVFDHSPGSDWIFHGAEEDKVRRSTHAMEHFGIRRRETFGTKQRFRDHAELLAKVRGEGLLAIERAERFVASANIAIAMTYELNLL